MARKVIWKESVLANIMIRQIRGTHSQFESRKKGEVFSLVRR